MHSSTLTPAVFLDRDGVLIQDVDLLTRPSQVRLADGAAWAVSHFKDAGYRVIVATNQTVVARGLATEDEVKEVHDWIQQLLVLSGGQIVDAFYFCPHHPNATLVKYRIQCNCRKPRSGMLQQAANDHHIDLLRSFMVGDRITDVIAGKKAGCATILVESGKHLDPVIETPEILDTSCQPDFICSDLRATVELVLRGHR